VGTAGQPGHAGDGLVRRGRLAEDVLVEDDDRVDAEDQVVAVARTPLARDHFARLADGVVDHGRDGVAVDVRLVVAARRHPERQAELSQDGLALRRARGQHDERRGGVRRGHRVFTPVPAVTMPRTVHT